MVYRFYVECFRAVIRNSLYLCYEPDVLDGQRCEATFWREASHTGRRQEAILGWSHWVVEKAEWQWVPSLLSFSRKINKGARLGNIMENHHSRHFV